MPICTRCDKDKLPSEFYTDKGKRSSGCKLCLKARMTKRYHADPEVRLKAVEAGKRWAERNPEKKKASSRQWALRPENRPTQNATYNRRRTRVLGNGGSYSAKEWRALQAQYQHTCLCCLKTEPEIKLTADHVIPVVLGGSGNIANIQPLCSSCNFKKGTKTTDYRIGYAEQSTPQEGSVRSFSKTFS
jgi:5-methylcytosine-specific restriction endonuclease McrA